MRSAKVAVSGCLKPRVEGFGWLKLTLTLSKREESTVLCQLGVFWRSMTSQRQRGRELRPRHPKEDSLLQAGLRPTAESHLEGETVCRKEHPARTTERLGSPAGLGVRGAQHQG